MIRKYLERRRTEKILSKYVSPEKAKEVMSDKFQDPRGLKQGEIEVVLIAIRDNDVEVAARLVEEVSDLASQFNGVIDHQISSVVIVTYGTIELQPPHKSERIRFVKALQEKFGSDVKVVHLSALGHFGNIGSRYRMTHTFVLPNFVNAFVELAKMNFGEVKEIRI